MPVSGKGVRSQRERWEGGRIRLLLSQAPVLIRDLSRGKVRALEPLLDLLLMPLAFHVTLLCAGLLTPIPALRAVTLWGLIIAASHLAVAIATCGGSWKDVAALMAAPVYVGWKLLMLPRILLQSRAAARWIRTERAVERSGQ
jgi:hypothetical protein